MSFRDRVERGWIRRHPAAAALLLGVLVYSVVFFLPGGREDFRGIGESSGGRTAWIASDDRFHAYVNGQSSEVGSSWSAATAVALPGGDEVLVAVEATNLGGSGGLVGAWTEDELRGSVPARWVCRAESEPGWQSPDFDDSHWAPAVEIGPFGVEPWGTVAGGVLERAAWVWTDVPVEANETIYCRWWILASDARAAEVEDAPAAEPGSVAPAAETASEDPGAPTWADASEPIGAPDSARAAGFVLLSVDNAMRVFLDGRTVGFSNSWQSPKRLLLERGHDSARVLAVEATNEAGPGGLLGVWLGAEGSGDPEPASWLCNEHAPSDWSEPDFDDDEWTPPEVVASYGSAPWGIVAGLELPGASWVWTGTTAGAGQTIYCRWRVQRDVS